MATIPLPERAVAARTLLAIAGENPESGGHILDFLRTAFPGFDWASIVRNEARTWQPYLDSGVSIDALVDEFVRYADVFAASRA